MFNLDFYSLVISRFPGLGEQSFLEYDGRFAGTLTFLVETHTHPLHPQIASQFIRGLHSSGGVFLYRLAPGEFSISTSISS